MSRLRQQRFAPVPQFDQLTQAVFQTDPVDDGEFVNFGVRVVNLPPVDRVAEERRMVEWMTRVAAESAIDVVDTGTVD